MRVQAPEPDSCNHTPALLLTSCVTAGEFFNLSGPLFPLPKGDYKSTELTGRWNELMDKGLSPVPGTNVSFGHPPPPRYYFLIDVLFFIPLISFAIVSALLTYT